MFPFKEVPDCTLFSTFRTFLNFKELAITDFFTLLYFTFKFNFLCYILRDKLIKYLLFIFFIPYLFLITLNMIVMVLGLFVTGFTAVIFHSWRFFLHWVPFSFAHWGLCIYPHCVKLIFPFWGNYFFLSLETFVSFDTHLFFFCVFY